MPSSLLISLKLLFVPNSSLLAAFSFGKITPFRLMMAEARPPLAANKFNFNLQVAYDNQSCKRMAWSLRSAADGSGIDSSAANDSGGRTRLIRAIQDIQLKFIARLRELRKNLPLKLFFFLVGFYCATAFATVIGQTGDWDVLSAALTVAVVEGIGALMYKASLPLVDNMRNLIVIFNYWKTGLSLGLFLDSFKY